MPRLQINHAHANAKMRIVKVTEEKTGKPIKAEPIQAKGAHNDNPKEYRLYVPLGANSSVVVVVEEVKEDEQIYHFDQVTNAIADTYIEKGLITVDDKNTLFAAKERYACVDFLRGVASSGKSASQFPRDIPGVEAIA